MTSSQQETDILYTIDAFVKSHIVKNYSIAGLQGDAGARRYWRITTADSSYILAHDPNSSSLNKYITYAQELAKHQIKTPKIIAVDFKQQLLLQEDFGDELLINKTSTEEKEHYYKKAIVELVKLQQIPAATSKWDDYSYDKLITEMSLTPEWYCKHHLRAPLDPGLSALFQSLCYSIASKILEFPAKLVHRDYHSRNLLLTPDGSLGVIDFQDAVIGPISYDLASLLRDYYCPISQKLLQKMQDFYLEQTDTGLSSTEFNYMFQLTALQRHLKVLGLFCRLYYRDGKELYLSYLPTVISYIKDAIAELPEYEVLYKLIPFENHA